MVEALGVALFALGIVGSLALHEAGHMWAARAFGMKVTRFFVGRGPTLWSFRRGETEYGFKAIPVGAFVKIVGMVRDDDLDPVDPADEPRAMWRYPLWKRTVVMLAGCVAHFALGVVILWGLFAFVPLNDEGRLQREPVRVAAVEPCVAARWTGGSPACQPGVDPDSAAAQLGLRPGDVIVAIDGRPVVGWDAMTAAIRAAGGRRVSVSYERAGQRLEGQVTLPLAERPSSSGALAQVGVLGVTPVVPKSTAGPIGGIGKAADQTVVMVEGTFGAFQRLPAKVPALWTALTGGERDPESPISVVGASRIGGELADRGEWPSFLLLLAGLNFFLGLFNLVPLLPLDGGHIAIAWYERARSWLFARLRRRDPGPVDYYRLIPVTYVVIAVFAVFTLLTVAADVVNPITLT
jgi:membrane-associated protease RseP (regulator of RpoE activity)